MVQDILQELLPGPYTAPRYIPPMLGGYRRFCQERVLDLFAAQRHGVPRILRQGHVISHCPGDRRQTPELYPSV